MGYELRSARWVASDVLHQVIRPGDTVIDATLGNGHDTVMLAGLVGENGRVIGFDIQPDAVERTAARLADMGLADRCTLHALGHQHIAELVTEPVRAAVFNLGWLPGGDKSITTLWDTTRAAVSAALSLLVPGGVVTICAYPGHAEGDHERHELGAFLAALRPQEFNVLHHRFLNAGPNAPECFVIQKNLPPPPKSAVRAFTAGSREITLRKATPADAAALGMLAAQMWSASAVELAKEFATLTANAEAACFLALDGDRPVGFSQCQLRHDYVEDCHTSPVGFLEGILVADTHQRIGIGRELLTACEDWARSMGCSEFASDCELDNEISPLWHMHNGFEESGRTIWFRKNL